MLGACGGLLELDDLEFTATGGAGGGAGAEASGGTGNAGSGNVGGTAGVGNSGGGGAGGSAGLGGNSGSAGSSGSAGNSSGGTAGCSGLGSEYETASALDCFGQQLAGGSADVAGGELRITPVVRPWYGQEEGVFFYQSVGAADFAAVSRLRVESLGSAPAVPDDSFAGGGIVLRAPAGGANVLASLTTYESVDGGPPGFGALAQFTNPGNSTSWNYRRPQGTLLSGYIGLCRSSENSHIATRLESEPNFILIAMIGPQQGAMGPDATTLTELGSSAHIYQSDGPDTLVAIDYLRVTQRTIVDAADCLSALNQLDD